MSETKTVQITLSEADYEKLQQIADSEDRPITWQARRFVRQGIECEPKRGALSDEWASGESLPTGAKTAEGRIEDIMEKPDRFTAPYMASSHTTEEEDFPEIPEEFKREPGVREGTYRVETRDE